MADIADLLKYKKKLEIKNLKGEIVSTVWVRVLGDYDLNEAYKTARIVSSKKRKALRDPETSDYQDEVESVITLTTDEKIDLIKTARTNAIVSEAQSVIVRPELPELDEIVADPDAAGLEDMEKLDKEIDKVNKEYQDKLQEYIQDKLNALEAELRESTEEKLVEMAKFEVSNIVPFTTFINELNDQKAYYGTFKDQACKIRAFDSVYEFKNSHKYIKDQIMAAINNIEIGSEEIKN